MNSAPVALHEAKLRADIAAAEAGRVRARFDVFARSLTNALAYRAAVQRTLVAVHEDIAAAVPELVAAAAAAPDPRAAEIALRVAWRALRGRIAERFAAEAATLPEFVPFDPDGVEEEKA